MKTPRIRLLLLFLFELLEAEFLIADNAHTRAEPERAPAVISEPRHDFMHPRTLTEAVKAKLLSSDDRISTEQLSVKSSPRVWNVDAGKLLPGAKQVGPFRRMEKVGDRFQDVLDLSQLTAEEASPKFSKSDEIVIYGNCKDAETCQSVLLALQVLRDRGYTNIKVLDPK